MNRPFLCSVETGVKVSVLAKDFPNWFFMVVSFDGCAVAPNGSSAHALNVSTLIGANGRSELSSPSKFLDDSTVSTGTNGR